MSTNTQKGLAIALVAMLAIGGVAPTVAGISGDDETTTDSSISDLLNNTTVTEPQNASEVKEIELIGGTSTNTSTLSNPEDHFTLRFIVNDSNSTQDGEVLYETTKNWTVEQSVSGAPDHYNTTVANTAWADELEYGAEQNVTVVARTIFNESESDESMTNISFTVAPNGSDARVEFVDDDRKVQTNKYYGFDASLIPFTNGSVGAAQVSDNVSVTENTSTVTMDIDNSTTADAFTKVTDATSTGDLAHTGYVLANGKLVPMFVGSESATWVDSGEAYAVVGEDASTVTLHNANSTFDSSTSSLEVTAIANEQMAAHEVYQMMGTYGASHMNRAMAMADVGPDFNANPSGYAAV